MAKEEFTVRDAVDWLGLNDLVKAFTATLQPDFGGVDWDGDETIQGFARDFIRIVHTGATTPAGAATDGGTR